MRPKTAHAWVEARHHMYTALVVDPSADYKVLFRGERPHVQARQAIQEGLCWMAKHGISQGAD